MTSSSNQINKFLFKNENGVFHLKTTHDDNAYILCFWPIYKFSSFKSGTSEGFTRFDRLNYTLSLTVQEETLEVGITSYYLTEKNKYLRWKSHNLTCTVTISSCYGKVFVEKTLCLEDKATGAERYDAMCTTENEFQQFKNIPDDTLIVTCQLIHSEVDVLNSSCVSLKDSEAYKKDLEDDLKSLSSDYLKEEVSLQNGSEMELVNKAILCARSPVFEIMFKNDMQEGKENAVEVEDIDMPVIKALVSFLYKGEIDNCDMDFLFQLYYCGSKYQISELKEACIGLMLEKVTLDNIIQVLELSLLHEDELLKSVIMTLISANIEKVMPMPSFKCFMDVNPLMGRKASKFFTIEADNI